MVRMFGWLVALAARASCSKRRTRSGSVVNFAGSSLSATTPEVQILRKIDLTHPARAEFGKDSIMRDGLRSHARPPPQFNLHV